MRPKSKRPTCRPQRRYPDTERMIVESELEGCIRCGEPWVPSLTVRQSSRRRLRDFGQYQILFLAESEDELLEQIQQVSIEVYRENRRRLEEAEAPRRLLYRLHRNPLGTMRGLIRQHTVRRAVLASASDSPPPPGDD